MRGKRRQQDKYDADGVPIDASDWTYADWRDLHFGIQAIKARIAARHAQSRESTAEPTESKP